MHKRTDTTPRNPERRRFLKKTAKTAAVAPAAAILFAASQKEATAAVPYGQPTSPLP